jgi:hypothetical protein
MDNNVIYHVVRTNVSILTTAQTHFSDEVEVTVPPIFSDDSTTAELNDRCRTNRQHKLR